MRKKEDRTGRLKREGGPKRQRRPPVTWEGRPAYVGADARDWVLPLLCGFGCRSWLSHPPSRGSDCMALRSLSSVTVPAFILQM